MSAKLIPIVNRSFCRRLFLAAGLLATLGGPLANGEEPKDSPGTSRRVQILLCGLTDDCNIGEAIGVSLEDLEAMLRAEIDAGYIGSLQVVKGDRCTAQNILTEVREVKLNADDTLYVFYAGHGAYDPRYAAGDPSGGHFFALPCGDLIRKDLFGAMQARKARLTVLISDTCNVLSYARPKMVAGQRVEKAAVRGNTRLETLLLMHRGVVNISASSQGQFSWFSSSTGGWFTSVLCIDLPRFDAWQAMFDNLSTDSEKNYQNRRTEILESPGNTTPEVLAELQKQAHMTPRAFQLDVQRDQQKPFTSRVRTIERKHVTYKAVR